MIKNIYGESLVGIIIGVFVLSIAIIGVGSLIIYSNNIKELYENSTKISILRNNSGNIVRNIDTSQVKENEVFYLYKNTNTKKFEIYTGATNEQYKYIDEFGNKVDDLSSYNGGIYARLLWVKREDTSIGNQNQIIKASIRRLIRR